MQIAAVSNIKGGVGKTTTAVNLAYLSAAAGRRTVLWDLDPQGAATYTLNVVPTARASAKKLVSGKRRLEDLLAATAYPNLQLLPSDLSYRNLDVHLSQRKHSTGRLMMMIQSLDESLDCLVLDCPPGISLLTENVLWAADAIIVPMVPAPLSVRMLTQLVDFIAGTGWSDIRLLPFFSMVDRRRSLHEEIIASSRRQYPMILATEVPYWSEIERMSVRRAPLPVYAPESKATQFYRDLWSEIEGSLTRES